MENCIVRNYHKNGFIHFYENKFYQKFNIYIRAFITLLLPIIISVIYVIDRRQIMFNLPFSTIIALLFAVVWAYLGQIFIYRHYNNVYIRFWDKLSCIVNGDTYEIYEKVLPMQKRISKFILAMWFFLIILIFCFGLESLKFIGLNGKSDFYLYLFFIPVSFVVYLTSIGLSHSFIMIYTIDYICKKADIRFDILNEDGVGGFSIFSEYAIKTTAYLGSGVLFIPILLEYASHSIIISKTLTYVLILLFSLFLFLSIVFPILRGYMKSSKLKDDLINRLKRLYYNSIVTYRKEHTSESKINIDCYKYEIEFVEAVSAFPFKIGIIIKLLMTTLMPVITYFVQLFISSDMVIDFITGFL